MARFNILLFFSAALFFPLAAPQLIGQQCLQDVTRTLQEALTSKANWALRMIDASTKFPDGLLIGNWDDLGHWDECLSAVSSEDALIKGQFCRATLITSRNLTDENKTAAIQRLKARTAIGENTLAMRASVCAPASCSPKDLSVLITGLSLALTPNMPALALVDEKECFTLETETPPLEAWTIVFISVFGLILCATVISTILHMCEKGNDLIHSLSAVTTTRQLLTMRKGSLGCVNGLKVFSMLWVVLGHEYQAPLLAATSNSLQLFPILSQTSFMLLGNAYLAVDTFFLIGGFLLAYSFFKSSGRQPFDAVKFYIYRYLRLAVPLAVMIAFYMTVLNHMANGPVWYWMIGQRFIGFCTENWWQAITFINNYFGIYKQCVEQSWYTSVDMQLAWLSPLILLPLAHSPRAGVQLASLLVILSCALPGVVTYLNNYPWSVDLVNDHFDYSGYVREIYLPTHARATPYLVGILLAYFMQHHTAKSLGINKKTAILGWIISTGACLAIIFTLAISFQDASMVSLFLQYYEPNPLDAAFYAGLHKLGWSLSLAWIVFACTNDLGGPVDAILSWRWFTPLSTLTYAAYLTHLVVIAPQAGATKVPINVNHYDMVHRFLADLPFILVASCIIYYLVEAPVMVLLRYLFKKDDNTGKQAQQARGPDLKDIKMSYNFC